jgi:predicted house-cleaning NTP pyrophosphatase (Maf/HAM1 superfamily)
MSLLAWSSTIEKLLSTQKLQIILASNSPRRKEILQQLLLSSRFEIEPSSFEENLRKTDFAWAKDYCLATAKGKAKDVAFKVTERNQSQKNPTGKFQY